MANLSIMTEALACELAATKAFEALSATEQAVYVKAHPGSMFSEENAAKYGGTSNIIPEHHLAAVSHMESGGWQVGHHTSRPSRHSNNMVHRTGMTHPKHENPIIIESVGDEIKPKANRKVEKKEPTGGKDAK
jgi:hypothetical protein